MALRLLIFSLILSLGYSCKTKQVVSPQSYEGAKITFGTEGGFAMVTSENYILESGEYFHFESRRGTTLSYGKIEKKVVKQLFNNFTALGLDQLTINDPGNFTYFIKMKEGDEEKIIKWGGMNEETPPILSQYFKTLGQIAKKYKTVTE